MDILIKNMELPLEERIQLSIYPNGIVVNHSTLKIEKNRTTAIELPEHGRLLDADEIVRMAEQQSIIHFSAMSAVRQVRTFMEATNGSDN